MDTAKTPLRFGHHALAVLGAATLGATLFSAIWTAGLVAAAGAKLPGLTWIATAAVLCWLTVFLFALPAGGLVLSFLFPVTRRRTMAANAICLIAGAMIGVVLAPLASPALRGASPLQIAAFALTGLVIAGAYLAIGHRLSRTAG
ncbi:hypothetical protein ACG3SL_02865 [Sphingomonas sp. CJ20]